MSDPRNVAVILAGGRGERAGEAKQWRRIKGRSLLWYSCELFAGLREIGGLVVVVPEADLARAAKELEDLPRPRWRRIVAGGSNRHQSSRNALAAIPEGSELVLIHDAARPFASPVLIRRLLRAAQRAGAAIPVLEVHDSTIELNNRGNAKHYVAREKLRSVQTPQAFRREVLEKAFGARRRDWSDDGGAVLAAGSRLELVEGEAENQKITTAADLEAALRMLSGRRSKKG